MKLLLTLGCLLLLALACGGGDATPTPATAALTQEDVDEFDEIAESMSLGVTRREVGDHFEGLGFVFRGEDFVGSLWTAGDVTLSITGSSATVTSVALHAPFDTAKERALVESYVHELLTLTVPGWESGATWFADVLDWPDDEVTAISQPVPGVEVYLAYYPPPPSPLIRLEVYSSF